LALPSARSIACSKLSALPTGVLALVLLVTEDLAKPRPVVVPRPLLRRGPAVASSVDKIDELSVDDVVCAGQVSCPAVVARAGRTAGEHEDREPDR